MRILDSLSKRQRRARAKIIATVGPASESFSVLRKMMVAGMDVARLNFSHGSHHEHHERIKRIRTLNLRYKRHIRILQDLEGHRIRLGTFVSTKVIPLKKHQRIFLTNRTAAVDKGCIPLDYEGSLFDVRPGTHIYIDDGTIVLRVRHRTRNVLEAEVLIPGFLKEHKGVNIPDVSLPFKGLSPADRLAIQFGLAHQVDYIAQSFVRTKQDILLVKDLVRDAAPDCLVIAKIENREGISHIDSIIGACDGIMIARGDMGVSLPLYQIPFVQKEIIKKCNRARKLVITATQMLESMVEHYRPTRAEVTDVANAIIDGSDFVMLSAETAAGAYPVEAVAMMDHIIKFTESTMPRRAYG